MSHTFSIKKGDRFPAYSATLTDSDGDAVNITGNTGVTFRFKAGNNTTISGTGTVVSATAGTVRYDWSATDTDIAGQYQVEVVVSFAGGDQTFPSAGYGKVNIVDNLA